jgi:alpha-D-ribose 1-methylphosphonate 5-triphosphate synthase subunit PhnH
MAETIYSAAALDSSRDFRMLLDAMAKPGHVFALAPKLEAIGSVFATTLTIAQTLFDFQTPIWLAPELSSEAFKHHLKFHTGAPIITHMSAASFAVLTPNTQLPSLLQFGQGTHEYPDRSTTLIIQVEDFSADDVVLSGPGLKDPIGFGAKGLFQEFWADMIANQQSYPLGVDIIFASIYAIACCPRSTRITVMEPA